MRKINQYILALFFIAITLLGCSSEREGCWVETIDGCTKIWINEFDPSFAYKWEGETFDSVAHGKGVLNIIKNNAILEKKSVTAYYGSLSEDDIVFVGGNEKYVGELSGDKFNGYGVYSKSSEIYIGHFIDSKPHGFATLYKKGKPYYVGMWHLGTFHGKGTLYKEDGSIKSGEWDNGKLVKSFVDTKLKGGHYNGSIKNNKPDGFGKMEYANGSVYSGNWKDGKFYGKGTFINGTDTITSCWASGLLDGETKISNPSLFYHGGYMEGYPHGYCNLIVPNAFTYIGYMAEGEKSGYGEFSFPNGDTYRGDWEHNLFDGDGVYTYTEANASYDGQWSQGLQDGIGYYRSPEFAYRGEWEEGWINGYGEIVFKNKDKYIGNFVENRLHGEGNYLFSNGNKYSGEFIDGKFNGLGSFYFANGDSYVGEFKDGKIWGDGTLTIFENGKPISITANWKGDNNMPKEGSILFSNGDIYEGELVNGIPTNNGCWTSEKRFEEGKNWVEKGIDFYKSHKEEFEKIKKTVAYVTMGVAVAAGVTAGVVAIVSTGGAAAPAVLMTANAALGTTAAILNTVNNVTYVASAVAETASAVQDYRMETDEENKKNIIKTTVTNLTFDAALFFGPRVAKSSAFRATKVVLSNTVKSIGKKTIVVISKNKTFGKIISIDKDKNGILTKNLSNSNRKTIKSTIDKGKAKIQSTYLGQLIKKTKLYKTVEAIKAKGAITLSDKDFKALLENPKYIRTYIETYTGQRGNFQEFFIRLAMGNKQQVKEILNNPEIRKYVDRSIRQSGEGGVHEWLMTKNFTSFLTDSKWGEDGAFLAMALTKLVQRTERVLFKDGGGHPSKIFDNSSESSNFHLRLAKVIDSCSSKEELLIKVREFAKKELAPDSYKEFNEIFKNIFTLTEK